MALFKRRSAEITAIVHSVGEVRLLAQFAQTQHKKVTP
jgi:hypothetical protein